MTDALTMGPALLFCPGDRPERFVKAAERADAVIIDLEDAVSPNNKAMARENLLAHPLDPASTIVRINPVSTPDFELDLAALRQSNYTHVMLAKTETAADARELADYAVVALCETAKGILASADIAAEPNVVALMWGAEDLVASLGGTSSRTADGSYRAVALASRSQVLLAAGANGKVAIDSVYVDIPDTAGLTEESEDAVASGFGAKACIHPSQVAVVRQAYAPTAEEVTAARELLAAAAASGSGVFAYEGKMIDGPILKHAVATLRRSGEQ